MNVELNFANREAEPVKEVSAPLPFGSDKKVNVILASNSPRRRELLSMILPSFSIAEKRDVEENYPAALPAVEVPEYLSQLKAKAYSDLLTEDDIVITADTVVILDGEILGKPKDNADAVRMLRDLSGREHIVVTGVTISSASKSDTFREVTKVHFTELGEKEIKDYVRIFAPLDKAGAYGIQEWIGAAGIDRIDGCFYNVMGLPLHSLYVHLKHFFT